MRGIWVTLIQKIRLEYPAFLGVLRSLAGYLGTLSLFSVTRNWALEHSCHLFFLLWSLLTNQELCSHSTPPFAWSVLSRTLCLWLCPWLQWVIDYSIRDVAYDSGLFDCKPIWTISPVIFFIIIIIITGWYLYIRITTVSFQTYQTERKLKCRHSHCKSHWYQMELGKCSFLKEIPQDN